MKESLIGPVVTNGYAFVAFDQTGHGLSDGLHIYIEDRNELVTNAYDYFQDAVKQFPQDTPKFIMGYSLGGAVALMLSLKYEFDSTWRGLVLLAPMVKITEQMRPSKLSDGVLRLLVRILPKYPLVPSKDLVNVCFKVPETREIARRNPLRYDLGKEMSR